MTQTISILSTKTLSDEQRQAFIDAKIDLLEQDFIEIENSNFELKNINDNLIFTSQNAVQSVLDSAFANELKTKNVFCVGLKTRTLLEENGFSVTAFTGYAEDLAEIITLVYNSESYTFFSGNLRKDTLPNILKETKIKWNEIRVYDTHLKPYKVKEKVDAILFFSPSGIESYLKDNKIKDEICVCIGNTTADTLTELKVKNITIADSPTIESVIKNCILEFK